MKSSATIILSIALFFGCASQSSGISNGAISSDTLDRILVNQVGYLPNSVKIALLRIKSEKFDVIDAESAKVVFTGTPGPFKYWQLSGDSVCTADFSTLTNLNWN